MKILRRPLLLVCAAILINTNTGVAADDSGDFLTQTRDLLSGNVSRASAVESPQTVSADRRQASTSDVQEQARAVILGKPKVDGVVSEQSAAQSKTHEPVSVSAGHDSLVHTDLQESIRRMILGTGSSGRESHNTRLSATQDARQ